MPRHVPAPGSEGNGLNQLCHISPIELFLPETFLGTRCPTSQQEEGCSSTARSFRTRSHPGASGFRHTGVLSVPAAQETLPDPESEVRCQRGRSAWHTG